MERPVGPLEGSCGVAALGLTCFGFTCCQVLERVTGYLDPASLASLQAVCKPLRTAALQVSRCHTINAFLPGCHQFTAQWEHTPTPRVSRPQRPVRDGRPGTDAHLYPVKAPVLMTASTVVMQVSGEAWRGHLQRAFHVRLPPQLATSAYGDYVERHLLRAEIELVSAWQAREEATGPSGRGSCGIDGVSIGWYTRHGPAGP
jgi:hypothetical protein